MANGLDFNSHASSTARLTVRSIGEPTESVKLGIRYVHENREDMHFLNAGSFDAVVSNAVLQYLPDFEAALESMHRVLVKGVLVFSILHPSMGLDARG